MFCLSDDHMFARRLPVARDTLRTITNLHVPIAVANPNLFAGVLPRNGVAAALPGHICIARYFPQLVVAIRIRRSPGARLQIELLRVPPCRYLLTCGSVH